MRKFKYKPGQWLFLNIPSVSRQQWHPFTITSCPLDPYISLHVRQVGEFTRAISGALEPEDTWCLDESGGIPTQLAHIRIDGPYGSPAEDVLSNRVAVLIGTGIGVTPWASILRDIWYTHQSGGLGRLRRVEFVWIYNDTSSVEWLQALLSSLEMGSQAAYGDDGGLLRIHTYLTQEFGSDTAQNIVLNSTSASDPLTRLRARTNFGRPNFTSLLTGIRLDALEETARGGQGVKVDVGVFFCGKTSQVG